MSPEVPSQGHKTAEPLGMKLARVSHRRRDRVTELNGQEGANPEVVVVGAGIAGLACAGTLVLEGHDTLLIAETPEVGWNLRPVEVEGNRGYVQILRLADLRRRGLVVRPRARIGAARHVPMSRRRST